MQINFEEVVTPAYIVDESLLIKNLEILKSVSDSTGCKILLAQKAFSMFSVYPLIAEYLDGTTASSLFEARLGYEEMGKEAHIFAPAYREDDFPRILRCCDHIVFNTFSQWKKYKPIVKDYSGDISCGIRINPQYSEIKTDIYNPCIPGSRMGTTAEHFQNEDLEGIEGLHFHTLCEQNSDTLKRTLEHVEEKFGHYLHQMKWLNFGGGHHITRRDYDVWTLIDCIEYIQEKYQLQVYLEPGEAVALNTGYLAAGVLDVMENDMKVAILDTSAACHMPDVIEMPYRPEIINAGKPGEKPYTYRLTGNTCLAGDVIGDYSFDQELKAGDKLVFCDMSHYTMVKNNTFNGINLPTILLQKANGEKKTIRRFKYEDFKMRLS